jgi:hypothetical protein
LKKSGGLNLVKTLKFRKRPLEVDAFQWPSDNPPNWWKEMLAVEDSEAVGNAREYLQFLGNPPHALIATLEGVVRVNRGDWIIRNTEGDVYPCNPDIFTQLYEPFFD